MELNRAVLTGTFHNHHAVATFERSPKTGWTLYVVIAKKTGTYTLGPSCKPCWTIAREYFDKLVPSSRAKPKTARKREIDSQTAGYFRVITGDR